MVCFNKADQHNSYFIPESQTDIYIQITHINNVDGELDIKKKKKKKKY